MGNGNGRYPQGYGDGQGMDLMPDMMPPNGGQGPPPDAYQDPYGGMMPGGGFPGMPSMGPEPTSYLKDVLQFTDYTDYMYHKLRGEIEVFNSTKQEQEWVRISNAKPGEPGGPLAGEAGISIIMGKVSAFLNKFAAHATLSEEEIHGYAFAAAEEVWKWMVVDGAKYQIQRWAWDQISLLVDSNVFFSLSRALGGNEADRISRMYRASDPTTSYMPQQQHQGGGFNPLRLFSRNRQ
jgi:hypothetical protein